MVKVLLCGHLCTCSIFQNVHRCTYTQRCARRCADGGSIYLRICICGKTGSCAVDVYIECSNGGSPEKVNEWFDEKFPLEDEDGNKNKARIKAIKGFLIEHRKVGSITYHLPYYWQVSEDAEGKDTSAWVLLNAIWG